MNATRKSSMLPAISAALAGLLIAGCGIYYLEGVTRPEVSTATMKERAGLRYLSLSENNLLVSDNDIICWSAVEPPAQKYLLTDLAGNDCNVGLLTRVKLARVGENTSIDRSLLVFSGNKCELKYVRTVKVVRSDGRKLSPGEESCFRVADLKSNSGAISRAQFQIQ